MQHVEYLQFGIFPTPTIGVMLHLSTILLFLCSKCWILINFLIKSLCQNSPQFITQQIDQSSIAFGLQLNVKDLYLCHLKNAVSKSTSESALLISDCPSFIYKFLQLSNNYVKLIKILNYVFRLDQILKEPKGKASGRLTPAELKRAEQYFIKSVQQKEFTLLSRGKELQKSTLLSLNPFLQKKN